MPTSALWNDLQLPTWRALGRRRLVALAKEVARAMAMQLVKIVFFEDQPIATFHDALGIPFQLVPGGRFPMGFRPSERARLRAALERDVNGAAALERLRNVRDLRPVHDVDVAPFLLASSCVDLALFVEDTDHESVEPERIDEVVDAMAAHRLRLPSEAEWEWACRGGFDALFATGDRIPRRPGVGENGFGLAGMGDLTELCADGYHASYARAPSHGGPWRGRGHVVRGGAQNLFPWQTNIEWMLMLAAMRAPLEDDDLVSFRPAISLFPDRARRRCSPVTLRRPS